MNLLKRLVKLELVLEIKLIKHILFDLDATLYSKSCVITKNITKRMIDFVCSYLNVEKSEAKAMRLEGLKNFGTTLEWLITEHGLSKVGVENFLSSVHPEEEKYEVPFDKNLRAFLLSLNTEMSILTNSPYEHAERILKRLKILDLFKVIVDLRGNNFKGKPEKNAYLKAISQAGFTIEETLFVDDYIKYVKGFEAIGGKAVLIDENNVRSDLDCLRISSVYNLKEVLKKLNGI